ncbi:hypothetical protein F66182_7522 [Fusarium sp. NRRL 66182]|nr:hypothetical protein F66182_7522 [Fusarium sp. NRRL 66182]
MATPKQQEQHWRAPYELHHGVNAVHGGEVQLESYEILHHLRGYTEQQHRQHVWIYGGRVPCRMEDLVNLGGGMALDFFNKTVPIFLLAGDDERRGIAHLLLITLHNHIYRKWFRPYRTDIERGQFIAKLIYCHDQPDTSDDSAAVDLVMRMRTMINTQLRSIRPPQFYAISPLMKALSIIVPGQNYHSCDVMSNLGSMRVLVLVTGETEGLSGPISFDSIADRAERVTINGMSAVKTDLDTAIGFTTELEEREVAAFGPQPDPVAASTGNDPESDDALYHYQQIIAARLGWKYGPLIGPSSRWVDMERYPEWTGGGAQMDAVVMECLEKNAWKYHRSHCTCNAWRSG